MSLLPHLVRNYNTIWSYTTKANNANIQIYSKIFKCKLFNTYIVKVMMMTNSIIIEFNTGGFYTKSTLIMLNHLLRDSGFMILKGKKMWFLKNNEQYIPFQDYMKIEVKAVHRFS